MTGRIDPVLVGGTLAAVLGAGGGWLLAAGVARLVEPQGIERGDARRPSWLVPVATAATMLLLWWWEVPRHALHADGIREALAVSAVRVAAHGVLVLFLAAATWIDFRHRVIPDAITVPGVLVGLAWMTIRPESLLPVAREVPRSFAQPLLEPDVLGLAGPLHGPWPVWLAGYPAFLGLAAALAVFALWWCVGTEPVPGGDAPSSWWTRLATPRTFVAATGAAVVVGGWLAGGDHWRGLATSLAGLAVSAGIVWLTRAGASRALGREAMGLGDVTLMAMAGAWLGWQACLLACFLAVFIGLAHGVAQLVLHREAELPFGPSLCLAAAIVVVAWRGMWERTEPFFAQPLDMAAVVAAVITLTAVTLWAWHRLRGISGG